jgi:hypothetical protein
MGHKNIQVCLRKNLKIVAFLSQLPISSHKFPFKLANILGLK